MPTVLPELRHLLKLLDDDSPVVREALRAKLIPLRRTLPEQLLALDSPLDEEQERLLNELLAPACREELEESWLSWRWLPTPEDQLEEALGQLSAFLNGWKSLPEELGSKLDEIAANFLKEGNEADARKLAEYLFGGRGHEAKLRGNSKNYYATSNSNLLWVISHGLGNPLSLCAVYILLGKRLGLKIQGCNFPGHFLSRVELPDGVWLVDCFNRGRFMVAEDVAKHHPAANPSMEEIIHQQATVETIIARVLRNLDDSFDREGNQTQRQVVRKLLIKLMEG